MATGYDITNPDGNNLIGSTTGADTTGNSAQTLEPINHTGTRIDFSIKWTGSDGAATATWGTTAFGTGQPSVGIITGDTIPATLDFGATLVYKNGESMSSGLNALLSIDWAMGTQAGTIKELWYGCTYNGSGFVTGRTLLATRDNIDPGYGAIGAGRPGPRYTFMLSGAELRGYTAYKGIGQKPICIQAGPKNGFSFPACLEVYREKTFAIEAVNIGAAASLSTILSPRDEQSLLGGLQDNIHVRIYQNGIAGVLPDGEPTDVDTAFP